MENYEFLLNPTLLQAWTRQQEFQYFLNMSMDLVYRAYGEYASSPHLGHHHNRHRPPVHMRYPQGHLQ